MTHGISSVVVPRLLPLSLELLLERENVFLYFLVGLELLPQGVVDVLLTVGLVGTVCLTVSTVVMVLLVPMTGSQVEVGRLSDTSASDDLSGPGHDPLTEMLGLSSDQWQVRAVTWRSEGYRERGGSSRPAVADLVLSTGLSH